MNWNEFAKEVHQNAVDHGWYDDDVTIARIVVMCHSELSEAVEEYRNRRPMLYFPCNAGGVCVDDMPPEKHLECGSRVIDSEHQEVACKARSKKPEGIAVELADCIIRILDWFGEEGLSADALVAEAPKTVMGDIPKMLVCPEFLDYIARWHLLFSMAYDVFLRGYGSRPAALRMALCINEIMDWGKANGVDMEAVLRAKHEYNKTRPYRHGGKAI